ncbi:Uncharacterised protein [Slackia heliotrinireducens]|uniref:Uncharacterized protein n=1 Tax=Slackia heliotrinireducens (strain ATCC 29202 / DSM 20476 / NCTC 11029 / RHS 1) TaxID=471855 RepID=C7N3S7_SLAHD|nr:hypothetical protein [Slackia heliotrinireducens]ACV21668.1 hypothetical protein Shel_06090 [Slackia heliotrinireducens DSM 20476]VEG99277.1 Uncharacterised protein [Slackia heliotrinireducens]
MGLKKGVASVALAATVAACLGVTAVYATDDYVPTTLGNSAYTNQVDPTNDVIVAGVKYVGSISSQNAESTAEGAGLDIAIGEATDTTTPVVLTNKTGQDITGFSYRISTETSFPANMLGSAIAADAQACWNLDEGAYDEYETTNANGITVVKPVSYTIQATLSDGSTAEFHDVNMNGVKTLSLCYSQEYSVYFVERTTITNHTPDPTLYYEVSLAGEDANADELDFHVNSSGRMNADKQITAIRGGGWDEGVPSLDELIDIPDYGVYVPLYGEPSLEYTDGLYEGLYWNADLLPWRGTNGVAGTWNEAEPPENAGEYGGTEDPKVDYHPGMDEGDWQYVESGTAD